MDIPLPPDKMIHSGGVLVTHYTNKSHRTVGGHNALGFGGVAIVVRASKVKLQLSHDKGALNNAPCTACHHSLHRPAANHFPATDLPMTATPPQHESASVLGRELL